jgi:hypothetical protein
MPCLRPNPAAVLPIFGNGGQQLCHVLQRLWRGLYRGGFDSAIWQAVGSRSVPRFSDKGRFGSYMAEMPLYLITRTFPGLAGSAGVGTGQRHGGLRR